jgi:1-aminocyclopropane-1-carboxylate deaminase
MHQLFNPEAAIHQSFKTFENGAIGIDVKREDLLHPQVSGNKLRKLKYNIQEAIAQKQDRILTYGGAFSNHIAATAAAGKIMGLQTIGVIRGEELGEDLQATLKSNPTLALAQSQGMQLHFVTRAAYKEKNSPDFQEQLLNKYGKYYNIPEGGTNALAVKGTSEILTDFDLQHYDIIAVAAGTGGTAAGIISRSSPDQKVLVFSALKGDFLRAEIQRWTDRSNFEVFPDSMFGGYARSSNELIEYMNVRFRESSIPLDPIYTSKMLYGIEHLVQSGVIKGKTRILAIHTGGLQGVRGYNLMLQKKGRTIISYENQL